MNIELQNEHLRSRSYTSMKCAYFIFLLCLKNFWIMGSSVLLFHDRTENDPKYLFYGIIIISSMNIYCYLYRFIYTNHDTSITLIVMSYRIFTVLLRILYFIFILVFVVCKYDTDNNFPSYFLWAYFIVEYIVFSLAIVAAFMVYCCSCSTMYPFIMIELTRNMFIITKKKDTMNYIQLGQYNNNHITLEDNNSLLEQKYGDTVTCPICYDDYQNNDEIMIFPCQHFYHKKCGTEWLYISKQCPMCRKSIEDISN